VRMLTRCGGPGTVQNAASSTRTGSIVGASSSGGAAAAWQGRIADLRMYSAPPRPPPCMRLRAGGVHSPARTQ